MKTSTTKRIIISAIFIALGVVLSRKLSIPIALAGSDISMNIGFGMLPILLIAIMYGPIWGCAASLLWDLIGAIVFPLGAFNPLFTIAAATLGLIVGLFYTRAEEPTPLRTFLAIMCGQLTYSVILNTVLIVILCSAPFFVILLPRLAENALMIVINTSLVLIIVDVIRKYNLLPERFRPHDFANSSTVDDEYSKKRYLLERGNHFLLLRQQKIAIQMYNAFIDACDNKSEPEELLMAYVRLLECYVEMGDTENARATRRSIEKLREETNVGLFGGLSETYDKCIESMECGIDVRDGNDDEQFSDEEKQQKLLERAEHYLSMKQFVLALQMFSAYLDIAQEGESRNDAQFGVLECYVGMNDFDNARKQYAMLSKKSMSNEIYLNAAQIERLSATKTIL